MFKRNKDEGTMMVQEKIKAAYYEVKQYCPKNRWREMALQNLKEAEENAKKSLRQ